MKTKILGLLVVGLLVGPIAASAATVFSDNFNASASGLNVAPTGWTVTDGTVDVVSGGFCVSGFCVDLDGSTSNAGVLSRSFSLVSGLEYLLSFDLSGNQRGGSDNVVVTFGTATLSFTGLAASAPYARYSLEFTPSSDGTFSISFANAGGDNVGALLDNVVVTSGDAVSEVPEPGTLALLGLGLAGLGLSRRRKA